MPAQKNGGYIIYIYIIYIYRFKFDSSSQLRKAGFEKGGPKVLRDTHTSTLQGVVFEPPGVV